MKIVAWSFCILISLLLSANLSIGQGNFWQQTDTTIVGKVNVTQFAVSPSGDIFAGGYNQMIYRSSDDGNSWLSVRVLPAQPQASTDGIYVTPSGVVLASFYAQYANGGGDSLFRSTDNGTSWTYIVNVLGLHGVAFASDPYGNLYSANPMMKSVDTGKTWQLANVGITPGVYGEGFENIAVSHNGYLFYSNGKDVYRSTNHGNLWTLTSLTNVPVYGLAIYADSLVYAATEGYGVWLSTDNGGTWNVSGTGLSGLFINVVVNPNGRIFAGGRDGVSSSTDGGSTWTQLNSGLEDTLVFGLVINPSGYLFAGVAYHGVFRSIQSVTAVEAPKDYPTVFSISQNYPNPFNPTTQIRYTLSKESNITLTVYDILGMKIATLVNGKQEPGDHTVNWNALNVPSGVYFYKIVTGDFVQTKKMVLLK